MEVQDRFNNLPEGAHSVLCYWHGICNQALNISSVGDGLNGLGQIMLLNLSFLICKMGLVIHPPV